MKRGIGGRATFSSTSETPFMAHDGPLGKETSQATIDVAWTVSFEPPAVEMDLIPQAGYEKWEPRGGKDEETPGSTFAVKIDIHKAGQPGVAPDAEIKRLTVWLADTSREPGVCMNYPQPGERPLEAGYDFRIGPTAAWTVTEKGQRAEATNPAPQSNVVLNCYDYGGWTQFMATAELAGGWHIVGRVKGKIQSVQLAIPKDDNGNRIADGWKYSPTCEDAWADADSLPRGNGVAGDGLSVYEEYRGFKVQGGHTRTDPIHKDLFIYDPDNLVNGYGIGLFGVSGLTLHLVLEHEFAEEEPAKRYGDSNPNVINFNRGYATGGAQHLITMRRARLDPKFAGLAYRGPPRCVQGVYVSRYTSEDDLPEVIAHELGHACCVDHHGDRDYDACDVVYVSTEGDVWIPTPRGARANPI